MKKTVRAALWIELFDEPSEERLKLLEQLIDNALTEFSNTPDDKRNYADVKEYKISVTKEEAQDD